MKKICFKVDANGTIGQGHVMRCLALAAMLHDCWEVSCHFIASDQDTLGFLAETGYPCHCLNMDYRDYSVGAADATLACVRKIGADMILVDSYDVTDAFVCRLRQGTKVACFWCGEDYISADAIINYNIDLERERYERSYAGGKTRLLLGADYIPLREEFRREAVGKVAEEVRSVLVLTGGSDNREFLEDFVVHLQHYRWCQRMRFTCIMGKYCQSDMGISGEDSHSLPSHVRLIPHVSDVLSVIKEHDLVLSAGGTTVYELCAIGMPAVIFSIADNQVGEAEYMSGNGIMPYAGDSREPGFWDRLFRMLEEMVLDRSKRERVAKKMSGLVDGKGAERIGKELMKLMAEEAE